MSVSNTTKRVREIVNFLLIIPGGLNLTGLPPELIQVKPAPVGRPVKQD
jgi:hypothetical protein